jgi:serine/threonine protein kinase
MPGGPPVDEDQSAELLGDEPNAPAHPDESTLLLPSPADSVEDPGNASDTPVAAQKGDSLRLLPGESLAGRFTIVRFIARGGMGAVYEAADGMLKTRMALKIIGGHIATDATELERVRREVLLSRRVSHPNVCRVYELYEAKTVAGAPIHFLTMELLEGETLARRLLRGGILPTAEMLPLVRQMCDGLAAAHAEGVIHRDFKSSNVMLVPGVAVSGEPPTAATSVVITDFGVARALDGERGTERLSGGAAMLGTPDYMAPEQVTGAEVTPATDIYALGVVIYEMATGKLPFAAKTPLASAARRLNEAPPRPEVAAPGLDKRWAETITRCLARQPDRRFQSTREVLAALDMPRRPRSLWLAPALGALLLALGAFALIRYRPTFWPQERQRAPSQIASRHVVAILGFRNELASHQLNWLPTAVSELIARELAAAETSLRVIPTDRIAKVRRSLGISEDVVADENNLPRMKDLLAANVLVYGSLTPTLSDSNDVTLSIDVVDAQTSQHRATFQEDIGPNGVKLPAVVIGIGDRIRKALSVSLSQEEQAGLSTSRARSPDTVQAYAQGVMRLQAFDYAGARGFFEAARGREPDFIDAELRIIETWESQENGKEVRRAIENVQARKRGLTPGLAAVLNAEFLVFGSDDKGVGDAVMTAFDTRPDDVELGLSLVSFGRERAYSPNLAPRTALAIVQRLRQLPAPLSTDLRLDIAEASAAGSLGETKRAHELLTKAAARAKALDARTELASALREQWKLLYATEGRGTHSLPPLLEAEQLFTQVGEIDEIADTKFQKGLVLSFADAPAGLAANDEAAALFRRLGDRAVLQDVFLQSAFALIDQLELDRAREKIDDARAELAALGEPLTGDYFGAQAALALHEADLDGLRKAAQGMRSISSEISALIAEARALREGDHLNEARESLLRAAKLLEERGGRSAGIARKLEACPLDCDGGEPAKGLACLAEFADAPQEDRTKCGTLLSEAWCKYFAKDLAGAARAAQAAFSIADRLKYPSCHISSSVILMQVDAARGKGVPEAISTLRAELTDLESKKARLLAFSVAIALGEIELRAGRSNGRARLHKIEQDAKREGLLRFARRAREVLEKNTAVRTPAMR